MPLIIPIILITPAAVAIYKYRDEIKNRLDEIEKEIHVDYKVHRVTDSDDSDNADGKYIRCLELDHDFLAQNKDWQLMSLGQYLSQLSPGDNTTPQFLKKHLEIAIGKSLIQLLGKKFGAALLPIFGTDSVDNTVSKMATSMASVITAKMLVKRTEDDPLQDVGLWNLSLPEMTALINLHRAHNSTGIMERSSLEIFRSGEAPGGPLSFDRSYYEDDDEDKNDGIPNPFIIEKHFQQEIQSMEEQMKKVHGSYDPNEIPLMGKNVPIDERFLPDLHIGWGDARCTHTQDECLKNKLMALLLTKLGYNTYLCVTDKEDEGMFTVNYKGKDIHHPEEFIVALLDSDHEVEVCPRATMAQFGVAICAKEKDGSFTNIPFSAQVRTGLDGADESQPTYFAAPHGGMNVIIRGPLIGENKQCDLQFYLTLEGFTGYFADHDADVPWLKRIQLADSYNRQDTIRAIRMISIVSTVFNAIATDMNLPFGGYGLLGMCNDSAALIDYALRNECSTYPLLSTGKYLIHVVTYLEKYHDALKVHPSGQRFAAVGDMEHLIHAAVNLPTDLHSSPKLIANTARRYLSTYKGKSVFQITNDSVRVMEDTLKRFEKYESV